MTIADPFRDKERIVCLGSSTTQDGYWLYFLMNYVLCRAGVKAEFINAGVSGGNAEGALARLDCDVLNRRPDRVMICLGLNDVGRDFYHTSTPDSVLAAQRQKYLDAFRSNMTQILERLEREGVPVLLMSSFAFDQYRPVTPLVCCNSEGLTRLNEIISELAERFHLPLIDIFTPMTGFYKNHPELRIAPDGVHPERFGYLAIAGKIIEAVYGACGDSYTFAPVANRFLHHPRHLPFHRDADYRLAEKLVNLDPLLNTENWRIPNLPHGRYRLLAGGVDCGVFYAAELAEGIDATRLPTPANAIAANAAALLESLRCADLPLRRLAQCECLIQAEGGNPADVEETRRILERYLIKIADAPYVDYYRTVFEEYWQYRPDRKELATVREETLEALYRAARPVPYPVELLVLK